MRHHCAFAYLALALVNIEWSRPEAAETNLRLADDAATASTDPALAAVGLLIRATLQQDAGDPVAAYETLQSARGHVAERPSPWLRDWYAAADLGVRAARGDTEAVRESLTAVLAGTHGTAPALALELARICLAQGDLTAAAAVLDRGGDGEGDFGRPIGLEAALVAAQHAHERGDPRAARERLERLLAMAEPDGYRRLFLRGGPATRDLLVEHLDSGTAYWSTVDELIATIQRGAPVAATAPDIAETLTDREITVLRYLQSALSNAEIASDLCVSVNTVKTHVRNIYRKLDSTRRREAVRRARQLHLI